MPVSGPWPCTPPTAGSHGTAPVQHSPWQRKSKGKGRTHACSGEGSAGTIGLFSFCAGHVSQSIPSLRRPEAHSSPPSRSRSDHTRDLRPSQPENGRPAFRPPVASQTPCPGGAPVPRPACQLSAAAGTRRQAGPVPTRRETRPLCPCFWLTSGLLCAGSEPHASVSLGNSEKPSGTGKAVARGAHACVCGGRGGYHMCTCVHACMCLGSQGPLPSPGAAPAGWLGASGRHCNELLSLVKLNI